MTEAVNSTASVVMNSNQALTRQIYAWRLGEAAAVADAADHLEPEGLGSSG